jgi:F0F1-type ATP synthase membrane subunit a
MLSSGVFGGLISLLPFFIVFLVIGLEFAIAFLQAYVFTVLLIIYLNDALNPH